MTREVQHGVRGSDLPYHSRMLLGQQPVAGLIAHTVFGPRVHVIHILDGQPTPVSSGLLPPLHGPVGDTVPAAHPGF